MTPQAYKFSFKMERFDAGTYEEEMLRFADLAFGTGFKNMLPDMDPFVYMSGTQVHIEIPSEKEALLDLTNELLSLMVEHEMEWRLTGVSLEAAQVFTPL